MQRRAETESQTEPVTNSCPACHHLLWDDDLEYLRQVIEVIAKRLDYVLEQWCELYFVYFGDERTLSRAEFLATFRVSLTNTARHLLNKDVEGYVEDIRRLGRVLAERGVPFPEVMASLHLYWRSALQTFTETHRSPLTPEIYDAFDKLNHCRMIVLAESYFSSWSARTGARIHGLEREAARLPSEVRTRFRGLVGGSAQMRELYSRIEAAAGTRGTILIVGESGSGKELVARAVHESSDTPNAPFIPVNCAAIPKDLIESELFGFVKGAFSGANADRSGLFRAADSGTLFLDEITEMSPDTQSKLLRTLQERTVRPVGSTRELAVDARVIASTNRDPAEMMHEGKLRTDLYYRLQANIVQVPRLRDHLEDIELLVEYFIALFNERLKPRIPVTGTEDAALEAMRNYRWPGNVRELSNAIETAFTFGRSPVIQLADLPPAISGNQERPILSENRPIATFAEVERNLIARALETTDGNKLAAARLLKISRKKLYAKISKYELG
jgi:DNA-binding NtrC family response regulator